MRITEWKPSDRESARKGTFTLEMPSGMVIYECALVEKDGSRFIGMPQRSWKTTDGQTKYVKLIDIPDKDTRDKFNSAVLRALDAVLA